MRTLWWTLVLVLVLVQDLVCGEVPPEDCNSSMTVRLRTFRIITSRCNFTTLPEPQRRSVQSWSLVLVLPLVQVLVLVLGLPLNLVALWILMFRSNRAPSTSLFISLTLCDLLLLFALPFRSVYHFSGNHWAVGEALCRLVVALFYGNMYGSVLCLAFIALDRYVALVHPFRAQVWRTRRTAQLMVFAVWATVGGAMLPLLLMTQTFDLDEPRVTMCHDALPQSQREALLLPYFLCLFGLCFAPSLLLVLFCHGAVLRMLVQKGHRYGRAVRATALVLLVFMVSFVPSNVLLLRALTDDGNHGDDGESDGESDRYSPYLLSLVLSSLNTVLDPLIYYYISNDFRDKAHNALCSCRDHTAEERSDSGEQAAGNRTKLTLLSRTPPTNQGSEQMTNQSCEEAAALN